MAECSKLAGNFRDLLQFHEFCIELLYKPAHLLHWVAEMDTGIRFNSLSVNQMKAHLARTAGNFHDLLQVHEFCIPSVVTILWLKTTREFHILNITIAQRKMTTTSYAFGQMFSSSIQNF